MYVSAMKGIKRIQLFLITTIFLSGCRSKIADNKITIATAANMQFIMPLLVKEFTKNTDVSCELVIGSSGKLTAQIKEGAPYDVFVAANLKYPKEIYNYGKAINAPKVYGYGKLALWSMVDTIETVVRSLNSKDIRHIAVANPKTAPYGEAAVEVLKQYNLYDKLKNKLVFGESIAQTNQFINSKAVEIGFTAMSVVLSSKIKGKGNWQEIDTKLYTPIAQGVVLIKQEEASNKDAQKFYDFLFSKEAKNILKKYGYLINE